MRESSNTQYTRVPRGVGTLKGAGGGRAAVVVALVPLRMPVTKRRRTKVRHDDKLVVAYVVCDQAFVQGLGGQGGGGNVVVVACPSWDWEENVIEAQSFVWGSRLQYDQVDMACCPPSFCMLFVLAST